MIEYHVYFPCTVSYFSLLCASWVIRDWKWHIKNAKMCSFWPAKSVYHHCFWIYISIYCINFSLPLELVADITIDIVQHAQTITDNGNIIIITWIFIRIVWGITTPHVSPPSRDANKSIQPIDVKSVVATNATNNTTLNKRTSRPTSASSSTPRTNRSTIDSQRSDRKPVNMNRNNNASSIGKPIEM